MFPEKKVENQLHLRREETSRLPENLPSMTAVKSFFKFVSEKLDELLLVKNPRYIEMRRYLGVYAILTNSRRGEEVQRLTLNQCSEGLCNRRKNPNALVDLNDHQQMTVRNNFVFYVPAKKGGESVSIVILKKYEKILDQLCNPRVRKDGGVTTENHFVFASVQSKEHASGWSDFNFLLQKSDVRQHINATQMRHLVSTSLDGILSSEEKDSLYKHLGHSKEMNTQIYQCPQVHKNILVADKIRSLVSGSQSEQTSVATSTSTTDPSLKTAQKSCKRKILKEAVQSSSSSDPEDDSDEEFCTPQKKVARTLWSQSDKNLLTRTFSSYIGGKDCSPRPISKNIVPLVRSNELKSISHLSTPQKVHKVRTTLYNCRRLATK